MRQFRPSMINSLAENITTQLPAIILRNPFRSKTIKKLMRIKWMIAIWLKNFLYPDLYCSIMSASIVNSHLEDK